MKKLFTLLVCITSFNILCYAQNYHFQEGFTKNIPDGWERNCSGTTALNHTGLPFSGNAAAKFDASCTGPEQNLLSPSVKGAGILTFYVSRNANNTNMTLHVGTIINGETTILGTYNAAEFPHKGKDAANPVFEQITLPVNIAKSDLRITFYTTIDENNVGWFAVDDIELTTYEGTEPEEPGTTVDKINTDFSDGSWGEILSAAPASGSYPSSEINGFKLNKAAMLYGSLSCDSGVKHSNRIIVDKNSADGHVELPTLTSCGELTVHATSGSEAKSFIVEKNENNTWTTIGTFETRKTPDSIYVIPIMSNEPVKIRVANNTGSVLYIWEMSTTTFAETKGISLKSSSPANDAVCFFNLTKEITLNFNKDILKGNENLILNEENISLDNCTIKGNTITIPVELEATQGVNKTYTLICPAGAFVDAEDNATTSAKLVITFSTLRTPVMPANYSVQWDVNYNNDAKWNRMDIYRPAETAKPTPILINMHGGGWNHGAKEEQTSFTTYFNMGYAVANIEYRMTPTATAPAAVEDVRSALFYLLNHARELNIDINKIVFQGGSAGGHLALMGAYLMNDRIYDSNNQYEKEIKIMAVIDKYGPANLSTIQEALPSTITWLGDKIDDAEFIKSLSPVYLVNSSTPATYIVHGDADPTVPYSQSMELEQKLQEAGVKHKFTTIPNGGHGGFSAESNTQINNEITEFLNEVESGTTKIENTQIEVNPDKRIFDLTGRELKNDFNALPKGIYIMGGKKVIK